MTNIAFWQCRKSYLNNILISNTYGSPHDLAHPAPICSSQCNFPERGRSVEKGYSRGKIHPWEILASFFSLLVGGILSIPIHNMRTGRVDGLWVNHLLNDYKFKNKPMQCSVTNNASQWVGVCLYWKGWDTPIKTSAAYLWFTEESYHSLDSYKMLCWRNCFPQSSLSHDLWNNKCIYLTPTPTAPPFPMNRIVRLHKLGKSVGNLPSAS